MGVRVQVKVEARRIDKQGISVCYEKVMIRDRITGGRNGGREVVAVPAVPAGGSILVGVEQNPGRVGGIVSQYGD